MRFPILCPLLLLLGAGIPAAEDAPVNYAPSAHISASSEYSPDYQARFVADGRIPLTDDAGQAWAVQGSTHRQGADLVFAWDVPVTVGQILYYGRTAYGVDECWKDWELYLDDAAVAAARGSFQRTADPQPIDLAPPVRTRSVRLHFTSSWGGANPGAAEVEILSRPRPATVGGAGGISSESAAAAGIGRLLLIRRHAINPSHVYTYHVEGLTAGGGLYTFAPGSGAPPAGLVDASQGIILDGNVSYDGTQALFSWKRSLSEPFQIWRIRLDGTGLTRITDHPSNNLNACWLPDGGIAFLSDRKPAFAYCWVSTTPILYRCAADGSAVVRLSANYLNDFTPSVMLDGRIIYSRWEYVDRPAIPIQSLWTINQDGTGLAGFFGNRKLSPATFMEARQIPGTGKVLCVLTSHNGPCRGAIGIVDPSQGSNAQRSIVNLTPEIDIGKVDQGDGNRVKGPYESPFPLDGERFLVSRGGTIQLRRYDGGECQELIAGGNGLGWYGAQPIRPAPRPEVRPSNLLPVAGEWAELLIQDVYNGLEPHVQRGGIARIAVVQEMEKSQFADVKQRAFGFQFPVVSSAATYAPKTLWGFATVESDGSAHFRVPSGKPIYFMALDAEGRALQRMRSFTHLMPGERQSCVGCHADRNHATPRNAARPLAALRPAQELSPPSWGVAGFSFSHLVQPVLDRHCSACHNAHASAGGVDLSGDRTEWFSVAYDVLVRTHTAAIHAETGGVGPQHLGSSPYVSWIATYNGMESDILEVTPRHWGSPASRLAELVRNGHPDSQGQRRVTLTADECQRLYSWMDLNVPYYGTAASNDNSLPGCRKIYPAQLDTVLKEVAAERCASCHQKGLPRPFYTRITHPQDNAVLLAPLARSAGGTQRCGQAVFASVDDPDYRRILATFDTVPDRLAKLARPDMVAAGP